MRTTFLAVLAVLVPFPLTGQGCSYLAEIGDQVRVTTRRGALVSTLMALSESDDSYGGQLAAVTVDSLRVEWTSLGFEGGKTFSLDDVRIEKRCPIRPDRIGGAVRLGLWGAFVGAFFGGVAAWAGEPTAGYIIFGTAVGVGAAAGALLAPSSHYVPSWVQTVVGGGLGRGLDVGFRLSVR
jgi:hypothetical protein